MRTPFLFFAALPLTTLVAGSPKDASDKSHKSNWRPCTAESNSGNYFDINPLAVDTTSKRKDSKDKDAKPHSWHARGYDYGSNFTLNFCGPVIEDLDDVEDVSGKLARNVSAYYENKGRVFSIGSTNFEPVVRGRKLVLNYTQGSLCPDPEDVRRRGTSLVPREDKIGAAKDMDDDDDDDDDTGKGGKKHKSSGKDGERRKSSIISLLCERNPKDGDPPVTVSFVGTTDQCTYFFEARSKFACATAKVQSQPLGPGSVFGIM